MLPSEIPCLDPNGLLVTATGVVIVQDPKRRVANNNLIVFFIM